MQKETTQKLKGENGIMRKKFTALKKDIEDQQDEIKTMIEKEEELKSQKTFLKQQIDSKQHIIDARNAAIGQKEKV